MIPRLRRGGRRVRGGTILPERHSSRFAGPRPRSRPPARARRPGRGPRPPVLAVPGTRTRRGAPLIAGALPVRGSSHRGDPRRTADRGVLHIGERHPRRPIPGFPQDSAVLASHWSCVDALPCAEGPALHMGGFHQRRVPGRFRMIPRILRWRVPIECAAPPRPAPIPHVRPGSAPRLGPTALVPLPPPTPAPMLTS